MLADTYQDDGQILTRAVYETAYGLLPPDDRRVRTRDGRRASIPPPVQDICRIFGHLADLQTRVYGHSVQGLLTLEPDPELQRKYLDLIDSALPLTDNERQQYEREFPREQTIMATLSERWKAEGIQQGMQQGLQQGRQEGRQEGREEGLAQGEQAGRYQMLARQLEKRFGVLGADTVARLAAASTAQLDQWAERILDAETLDDVFRVH